MLEMIRTRSGGSSHFSTEASIATVIATTETTVHELPTPRAMNNRTTTTTPRSLPLSSRAAAVKAQEFPEAAAATTYGDIAYRNDIESKMSTLSACSTPESLTSYEVENTSSRPSQSSVVLNEIALINISQSASTTGANAAAAAAFDAAAAPAVGAKCNNNDNISTASKNSNSVQTIKSNKTSNNDIIVQTVGSGNRTVTLIQSPVSSRSFKSSTSSRKGSGNSSHRGTPIQSPGSIVSQSMKSSPVIAVVGGGGGGSITPSIKSIHSRNSINRHRTDDTVTTAADNCRQERDDNATTTAEQEDQRHTNINEDEMSVELSIATQPTMQSPVVSPTSYTASIGGVGDDDNVSMADRTRTTSRPLLVEQHASAAENNEVEVQFAKGGKMKLSRKSKMFNPFKSSTEKTVKTAAAAAAAAEKKKRIARPLHNLVISPRVNKPEETIASTNGPDKQPMQLVDLDDSVSFSPTNESTTLNTTLNTTLAEISEDNIEVQACFGDDISSHEGRGSPKLILVNTATLKEEALLRDVLTGHNEPPIQEEVVSAAMLMEQANSGSVHSHSVSSNRPYSPVAKYQTTSTSEEAAQAAVESESLHSMSTATTAVVTKSPSQLAHKYASPLVRGILSQKTKLFKRISSTATTAAVVANSELDNEAKASSPKAKLFKSFGRFTKKNRKKQHITLVKLETVLETVAPLPECQPELLQPYEAAKTSGDNEIPESSTLEIMAEEVLHAAESIERNQSSPHDSLNMVESVKLLASCDGIYGSSSASSIKSVTFVSVATDIEDKQVDDMDDVNKQVDDMDDVIDHEPEAVHPMIDENESHDIIIQKTTSSTVNTSGNDSNVSGSGKIQLRMFMNKKAITSASARLSGYFSKKGKVEPLTQSSTTSDRSPDSTITDSQEAVSKPTDDAAGDTEPQMNLDASDGEVSDASKLAIHSTPEGFVTKQDNDEGGNIIFDKPSKLVPGQGESPEIPPMHAPEAKLYHALSEVKEKAEIAFTKREYASQILAKKSIVEEELASLLTTMRKVDRLENDETRMITEAQTKVDHARAEHAKAELASILAMAEATKARDDAKRALKGLSNTNRKKVRIEEEGDDYEEDMSIDFLASVSTASTMDSGHYSSVVEQADKNWLLDSDFMRYICCNGRDDFTMVSVDITDSLIGISHESSEIKESEYRVRDDTLLLDLIVT